MDEKKLAALIKDYKKHYAENRVRELNYYSTENNTKFIDAIRKAGNFLDADGNRHAHQWRIRHEAAQELQRTLPSIQTKHINNFDELHKAIAELRVKWIGPLAIFDTALRLGSFLEYKPTEVYLHCGAAEGYANLINHNKIPKKVPVESFPHSMANWNRTR